MGEEDYDKREHSAKREVDDLTNYQKLNSLGGAGVLVNPDEVPKLNETDEDDAKEKTKKKKVTTTKKKKAEKDPTKARDDDMRLVIDAPVSQRQIPTELSLSVTQMPSLGTRVSAAIQIKREALTFDLNDGKQVADLDIGGIFYDSKGKPVNSFVGRLKIFPLPEGSSLTKPIYNFYAWLPAGLYQVRVGVRDLKNGRIGSAMQWIEVPNISPH